MRAHVPSTLAEAVAALAEAPAETVVLAGCTDWLVGRHARALPPPEAVLDLSRVDELRGVSLVDGWLELGATTTFSELRRDELVNEHFPILAQAAATIGGWQIQNRATIGGNVANASPAGDSLPVLLALDAEVVIAGADGERRVRYGEFHRGYRKTALRPGELIARLRVRLPRPNLEQHFRKVGTRAAQAISKVVVAFTVEVEDGRLRSARLAAGSVAPTPVRLKDAEDACEGERPTAELARKVAELARAGVKPIDDVRSTARYRQFALERVVRRMILEVMESCAGA